MSDPIRRATAADAASAVDTLRRSISELCVLDHLNEPAEIEDWLRNKTEKSWQEWIARDDAVVLVAERDSKIVGVGMVSICGEVLLNYVHPEARFQGVSKALLAAMEAELRLRNVRLCWLESTVSATPFYENCGFDADMRGGPFHVKLL